MLGHTRWASVGIISQPNAHPLNSDEVDGVDGPYVAAALNGDVDNFADLKAADGLRIAAEITTDAKVIPTLVSRRALRGGVDLVEAFRRTVAASTARWPSGASTAEHARPAPAGAAGQRPGAVRRARRGPVPRGQRALRRGRGGDRYLRMDGETPADPDEPDRQPGPGHRAATADGAGTLDGHRRGWSYDGTELPVAEDELVTAEITTRDIDRGDHAALPAQGDHRGARRSFRKTLRGKLVERDGRSAGRPRTRRRCPTAS